MHRELKSTFFAILLVAASYLFGYVCQQTQQGYELLFSLSAKDAIGLALWLLAALAAMVLTAGLVAALVRPRWACFLIFAFSALAMLLGWELKLSSGLLAALYFIASLLYAEGIAKELNERLRFSVKPISQSQSILLTTLVIVVCGSLYLGYAAEIEREGFSLPPALVEMVMDKMGEELGRRLPADVGEAAVATFREPVERVLDEVGKEMSRRLPADMREAVMAEFRRQAEAVLDEMEREAGERLQEAEREAVVAEFREQFEKALEEFVEKAIRPYEQWIPVVFALGLFTPLVTITRLLSWIPILVLRVIFPFLTVLGVTKVVAETHEVKRLTLG